MNKNLKIILYFLLFSLLLISLLSVLSQKYNKHYSDYSSYDEYKRSFDEKGARTLLTIGDIILLLVVGFLPMLLTIKIRTNYGLIVGSLIAGLYVILDFHLVKKANGYCAGSELCGIQNYIFAVIPIVYFIIGLLFLAISLIKKRTGGEKEQEKPSEDSTHR